MHTLRPPQIQCAAGEVGRILVVDDNISNRDLLTRRLVQDGHDVTAAASGAEAFTLLSTDHNFDLVLLDVLMPDMNGIEILTRLKADERLHQIPVIMISGLQETEAVLRCIEAGADDYLPKPCDVVLLRARINSCLERRRWQLREQEYLARLKEEKAKSDALLRNILPEPVVFRLNDGETIIADRFEAVSILFADIVGFTPAAAAMTPASLVASLNRVFSGVRHSGYCVLALRRSRRSATLIWPRPGFPSRGSITLRRSQRLLSGSSICFERMFAPGEPVTARAHRNSHRTGRGWRHRTPQIQLRCVGRHS